MHFFERSKRLGQEFLKFKKYKHMHPAIAVFVGLFLFPFAVSFFASLGILFLLSILFTIVEGPLNYLHKVVKDEGKEMNKATEVVIYFFSWPLLFFFYVLYALLTLLIFIAYFNTVCVGYIASLGGYRFHITPNEENIEQEETDKDFKIQGLVFILVVGLLLLVEIVIGIVKYSDLYSRYQEGMFFIEFLPVLETITSIYTLFCVIYVPIAFRFKKIEKVEPVVEEQE